MDRWEETFSQQPSIARYYDLAFLRKTLYIITMETIFDHDVTDSELNGICPGITKKEYLEMLEDNEQSHLMDIYRLFLMRGNKAKAANYYPRLEDKQLADEIAYIDIED